MSSLCQREREEEFDLPCKLGKYGIKIFWCCDAETYPLAGEIYVGRQPCQKEPLDTADLVKRLVNSPAEDLLAKTSNDWGNVAEEQKRLAIPNNGSQGL
ncbi:hypothetical protein T10_12632 [Trichinella papuae]|uniref:PiggyBac transposable element-derived protein domain-containing protein n=1 Tax=Trichinella papuae TaxID=268474 RepID=A0A0V1MPZ8_9BILA|nr:hypothetical protein T10_12632 [Trichinella papuae]